MINLRKPTVGIMTAFTGADRAYSLVNVVAVQIEMLLNAGYRVVLFTAPNFSGTGLFSGKVVEIRRVVNPDGAPNEIFDALMDSVKDIDVMFAHDLVFLKMYSNVSKAVHKLAEACDWLAFCHWQHSRGDHDPIAPVKNSWFCYPNNGDLEHVAQINSTDLEHVRYVPHPLDFDYLGWPKLAIQIAEDFDFPFVDISCLLPTRMDRQKQVERAIRIFAGLKRAGKSVCFLVGDAYATGEHFKQYKQELVDLALSEGLNDKEFAFISDKYEECTYSTPRQVVKALLEMSNLFIQPSNAETSSLVVMEAALAGNVVVLNADFPPIHHLYQDALTLPFGSVLFPDVEYFRDIKTAHGSFRIPDPQAFWNDEARNTIIPTLDNQITIRLKRQQLRDRWPSKVFKEYVGPMIAEVSASVSSRPEAAFDPEVTAIVTSLDNLPLLQKQLPVLLDECGRVIVVSNGSQDGTNEWLQEVDEPRLTAVYRENLGAGPGRNAGLAEWDKNPTPYVLMVDGGIMPPYNGVKYHKDYLTRHPEVDIISPEVNSAFTTDLQEATLIMTGPIPDDSIFRQGMLSGTAYCLTRARVWDVRFCEEGPFGEPGWGADDNDMQYRWNEKGYIHYDYTAGKTGIKLYRRASGSFKRLFQDTGIWPNQYGSVYEKRHVKLTQDWRNYYDPIYNAWKIKYSFVMRGMDVPELAYTIKRLHDEYKNVSHEIIVETDGLSSDTMRWIEMFRYRWPWGNATIDDSTGEIIHRNPPNEAIWTGDFVLDREPQGETIQVFEGKEKENAGLQPISA